MIMLEIRGLGKNRNIIFYLYLVSLLRRGQKCCKNEQRIYSQGIHILNHLLKKKKITHKSCNSPHCKMNYAPVLHITTLK